MKVLHIIDNLNIGGAQRLLTDICECLLIKCDITVLALVDSDNQFKDKIINLGVKYVCLAKKSSNIYNPLLAFKMVPYIKDADIVHVHLFPALYYAAFASLFVKTNMLYTEHSTANQRRYKPILRPIEKFIYSQYSSVICVSSQAATSLQEWIGLDTCNILTIENGIVIEDEVTSLVSYMDGANYIYQEASYNFIEGVLTEFTGARLDPTEF